MKTLEMMTEPELSELLNTLAKHLEVVCAVMEVERPLFALLLFSDPALAQYVGNCERADIVKAFREAADRLESREDVPR